MTVVFGACAQEPPATIGASLQVDAPAPEQARVTEAALPSEPAPRTPARARRAPGAPRLKSVAASPAVIGRVVIPAIGLDLETYEGVDPWTLQFGPGHWEVTAQPGQRGNTVFAGHRTTYTRPFHDIDLLAVGDEVTFVNATGEHTYRTTEFFVVSERDVWIAEPTETPTFTLFACHPKGSERQRYVVKGDLVRSVVTGGAEPAPPNPAPTRQPRECLLCRR